MRVPKVDAFHWVVFEKSDEETVPSKARTLLLMEYEYARKLEDQAKLKKPTHAWTGTYINSLSVQAVLDKCATSNEDTEDAHSSTANTPPALFSSKLVDVYKQNAVYIAEVVEASRNLLRLAVDGLLPTGGLKHAPVRTHFRILSGAMFLLKASITSGIVTLPSTLKHHLCCVYPNRAICKLF